VRLLVPAVFGLAAVQVTVFVNTLLARSCAGLDLVPVYATRDGVPARVFGIALASASLPVMARHAAAGETRELVATLNFSLRLTLFISVPATVGLVALRAPIVRVLFERGRFGPPRPPHADASRGTRGSRRFGASRIAAQAFYALGQAGTAVRWGIVSVAVNVLAQSS